MLVSHIKTKSEFRVPHQLKVGMLEYYAYYELVASTLEYTRYITALRSSEKEHVLESTSP